MSDFRSNAASFIASRKGATGRKADDAERVRYSDEQVVFRHAFTLGASGEVYPPGRYVIETAEDSYAARALGLPEMWLRIASFALAGMIGALAGFTGAQMLLAFFGNQSILNFYGFVPVALGGMGSNRGALIGGLALGLFQQAANFLVGGIFSSVAVFVAFILVLLARPEGLANVALGRRV